MTYTESARAQLNALQTKDHVRILALETSCDETAAAIIEASGPFISQAPLPNTFPSAIRPENASLKS